MGSYFLFSSVLFFSFPRPVSSSKLTRNSGRICTCALYHISSHRPGTRALRRLPRERPPNRTPRLPDTRQHAKIKTRKRVPKTQIGKRLFLLLLGTDISLNFSIPILRSRTQCHLGAPCRHVDCVFAREHVSYACFLYFIRRVRLIARNSCVFSQTARAAVRF